MIEKSNHLRNILLLIGISFVFFMLGNNILTLTNPDEVFYSLSAKEMIQHKTWLVPQMFDQPQFEKPILTFTIKFLSFWNNQFWRKIPTGSFCNAGLSDGLLFLPNRLQK